MLDALSLVRLHDEANAFWHDPIAGRPDVADEFTRIVLEQHRANFDLWHQEDRARDPEAPDTTIAEVKHTIDRLNQQRNDLMERIDSQWLQQAPVEQHGVLHSESPGMMIDRLSILSLKIFHTAEEAVRRSVEESHRQRNRLRLETLHEQRDDLAQALDALWAEVLAGTRRFKVYKQMKMYNDPDLNPVLYRRHSTDRKPGENPPEE